MNRKIFNLEKIYFLNNLHIFLISFYYILLYIVLELKSLNTKI